MFEIIPQTVEKEKIASLQFPEQPLEHTPEKLSYLSKAISKALHIGNKYKNKISIIFYDNECIKEVRTTIWNVTLDDIILKNGVSIPFHRVLDVKNG